MPLAIRRLVPAVLASCALLAPSAALAGASAKEIKNAKQAGVTYLKSLQQANGEIPGFGREWVLTSFAAAGVAAANVKQSETATDARTFYRNLIGDTSSWPGGSAPPVTDFEVAALSAYAAGIDPARVSSTQNLIAQIAAHYQPANPGYYGEPEVFDGTVFGLLALADAKTRSGAQRVPQALLEQSIAVLRHNQHTDGGWSFERAEGSKEALESPAEAELTGATMAALCNAGVSNSDPAIAAAKRFLVSDLQAESAGDGAFATEFGANTDSNAWAVEGLNACGIPAQETEFTTSKGDTPITFLISEQLSEGGFRFEPSESSPNLYSSQDAVRALSGAGFTVAPPTPKGAPRWVYEKQFSTSPTTPALLTLIINDGTSTLGVCAVQITPQATATTLAKVLEAAESAATPSGCVSAFTPASGNGAITSIDGHPSPPEAKWDVSIDGAAEKQAKRNTAIDIGDTIYLRLA
jgi:hypothetical protein